ncbi:glycosyltransferase family 9 protein [Kitasatospora aureofaciens]|uniref:glycosyltransferase family 9 protein n=1 Tax=Kitasatospora aureofaciens TaxID=1894 RepID=UPI0033C2A25A
MTERPTLLVLRALGLGDLLTGVPALRALRRHHPGHELVLAAPARLAPALAATGTADRLLATDAPGREVPHRLPWDGPPPDLAVDLHGNGPASRDALARLRPARLIAYAAAGAPRWRDDEHERERWCRLLRHHGIGADAGDLLIARPAVPSPAPGAVLVHPGADAAARQWPPDRFAAVARALRGHGHRVVVTAGRGERALAEGVAREAGLPSGDVLGGGTDLPFPLLAALVAEARAVVCGDTGIAHLAAALGTPSVTLFGPVSPVLWGPPAVPRHLALWRHHGEETRPGDAHGPRPDPRLLRIRPADVLAALAELPLPPPVPPPGREAPVQPT